MYSMHLEDFDEFLTSNQFISLLIQIMQLCLFQFEFVLTQNRFKLKNATSIDIKHQFYCGFFPQQKRGLHTFNLQFFPVYFLIKSFYALIFIDLYLSVRSYSCFGRAFVISNCVIKVSQSK